MLDYKTALQAAGWGQLLLAAASLAIPHVLGWRAEVARLGPLTGRVFWTYAGYIWATNVAFGLLDAAAPAWLLGGSPLGRAVSAYISLYWGARLAIQLLWFRGTVPPGRGTRAAEAALVLLFGYLALVHGAVALHTGFALE